eukprot:6205623-Pleurochrysis_carterae.AAC.2
MSSTGCLLYCRAVLDTTPTYSDVGTCGTTGEKISKLVRPVVLALYGRSKHKSVGAPEAVPLCVKTTPSTSGCCDINTSVHTTNIAYAALPNSLADAVRTAVMVAFASVAPLRLACRACSQIEAPQARFAQGILEQ